MNYDAFISYSHSADGKLAPAVQSGLERLARPWNRRRALEVFRDQTGLSADPQLWTSIQRGLDESRYFVWMASPESAASPWVERELQHWLGTKTAASLRILPVLTDGELVWDDTSGDFDVARSSALPAALVGVFREEPRYVDLRWAHDGEHLDLRHSGFRQAVADLAAPLHGVSKGELEGEDIRQHRRVMRLAAGAVAGLLLLAVAATVSLAFALRYASNARASEHRAVLASLTARKNAAEATRQRANAEHNAAEAQTQRASAEQNAAEASRQRANAEQNAAEAQTQRANAEQNAAEAQTQRANAEQAAADATAQKNLADQSAAEASRQRDIAESNLSQGRALLQSYGDFVLNLQRWLEVHCDKDSLCPKPNIVCISASTTEYQLPVAFTCDLTS